MVETFESRAFGVGVTEMHKALKEYGLRNGGNVAGLESDVEKLYEISDDPERLYAVIGLFLLVTGVSELTRN